MSRWNKDIEVGERCVLTLPLNCHPRDTRFLDQVFQIENKLKNQLIEWYKTQLNEMTRTRLWREASQALADLHTEYGPDMKLLAELDEKAKKKPLSKTKEAKRVQLRQKAKEFQAKQKPLYETRNGMIRKYEFSRGDFEKRMAKYRRSYTDFVGSMVAQRLADDVWDMFQSYLYGKGKAIRFSGINKFLTIEGKNNSANIVFDRKAMKVFIGQGRHKTGIRVKRSRKDPCGYEAEALSREICYCRITRKAYPEGWRYFLQLVLKGAPPVKVKPDTGELLHPMGEGRVGMDIGPQTLAYCGEDVLDLVELAPGAQNLQEEIRRINRAMDRSRRATNPGMFDKAGQIIPGNRLPRELLDSHGKRKWVKSKQYREMERHRRYLYRKQADLRKAKHQQLANKLLAAGDRFYVEDMSWRALSRRSKQARKNKKGKNLSKKRFGKSIANKSPGAFLSILEKKVLAQGGSFYRINIWKARASQFHHMTGQYIKKKLSQRVDILEDGSKVQRDLYSAFLIMHSNKALDGFLVSSCNRDYPKFLQMHNKAMAALAASDKPLPSSMGVRRKAA